MNTDTRPTARLDWSLYVECPKCEHDFDLVEFDSQNDYCIAKAIFSNDWEAVAGQEAACPKCSHEFELAGIEY